MPNSKPPPAPGKHFTVFPTAAEEAAAKAGEAEWDNEGGHMSSTAGRIVSTPGATLPYKVVLSHHGCADSERGFATMREAEAFVRRNTPVPAARRNTLYDRAADQDLGPSSLNNEVSP
jgi:hypothetical protein